MFPGCICTLNDGGVLRICFGRNRVRIYSSMAQTTRFSSWVPARLYTYTLRVTEYHLSEYDPNKVWHLGYPRVYICPPKETLGKNDGMTSAARLLVRSDPMRFSVTPCRPQASFFS